MRPLKLELKGFTVYRKPQTIDFSKLRFFVIQGKTGAGKTSIIDAITYALYGKVPRYSSQSATKYVLSRGEKELKVILDFSVRGRKYRIERYYRAFPEDSQVRVYEEGKRLNIKANQVEKWLQQISGIDYKTFTKVILLPQGEFDKFLKEGKERKNLLIKLLGLEELEKISKLAGEEFKNLEGRREALKKEYGLIKEYTPQLKERLQKELQNLQLRLEELTKKEEQIREELRKSKEKKELYEEYKRVLRDYESLAEEKEEIESLKEKLEISRKVSPYVPIAKRIEEIDEALSEIKLKKQKLLKEHTILSEELKNLKEEEKKLQVEKEKVEEYRNREKEIELILKKLLEIKEYILEVETLQRERKELEKEFQKAKEEYTDLTRRVEKGRKIIEEEERKLKGIEEKFSEEEYTSLKTKERLLKELEKKERELQKKENEYETVKEKLDTLHKEYTRVKKELEKAEEELKKRELYYHAHMVSSYLSEGDTCPVCGGTYRGRLSHSIELGDINELKAKTEKLEKEEKELDKRLELLKQKLSILSEEIEKLKEEIIEYKREIPKNLKGRLNELEKLKALKEKLEEKLKLYRQKLDERIKQREEVYDKLSRLQNRLNVLEEKIKERLEKINEFKEFYNCGNISKCEKELKEELESINNLLKNLEKKEKTLREEIEKVSLRKSKIEGELSAVVRNIELLEQERREKLNNLAEIYEIAKSPQEVLNLYLGEKEKILEERIKDFEEKSKILSVKKRELEEKVKLYEGIKDYEDVEEEYLRLRKEIDNLSKKIGEIKKEIEYVEEKIKRKEEVEKELKDIERKLQIYSIIKTDFRADRFQKYVAEIMLRKVVDRASEYFYKFTGTYFFELEKTLGSRDRDIVVVETTTNQIRPVSSLSGGETFLASLSLAFGVSDILSGNANLESLFIDEGFGSLDQDMRERVSEILEAIKTNVNKMIGIISHIPDFAERFSERIIVEKKGDFSEVKVIL